MSDMFSGSQPQHSSDEEEVTQFELEEVWGMKPGLFRKLHQSDCNDFYCELCDAGGNECFQCEEGYYVDSFNDCDWCGTGCTTCTGYDDCTECKSGYTLETDGTCSYDVSALAVGLIILYVFLSLCCCVCVVALVVCFIYGISAGTALLCCGNDFCFGSNRNKRGNKNNNNTRNNIPPGTVIAYTTTAAPTTMTSAPVGYAPTTTSAPAGYAPTTMGQQPMGYTTTAAAGQPMGVGVGVAAPVGMQYGQQQPMMMAQQPQYGQQQPMYQQQQQQQQLMGGAVPSYGMPMGMGMGGGGGAPVASAPAVSGYAGPSTGVGVGGYPAGIASEPDGSGQVTAEIPR